MEPQAATIKLNLDRKIAVIGLGYVGLPVAVAFGEKQPVIAFDISQRRITQLQEAYDVTGEVESKNLKNFIAWKNTLYINQ